MFSNQNHFCPRLLFLGLLMALAVAGTCSAAQTPYGASYQYLSSDFSETTLDGIVITGVPDASVASIQYGSRTLRSGDVLSRDALSQLTLTPITATGADATLTYLPVCNREILGAKSCTVTIGKKVNEPPAASDSAMETYKNIANTGALHVTDPEGDALTYTVVTEPKRGVVVIAEDGTFTYTPNKNKVGGDRFTYVATDVKGNISNEATVTVEILKPTIKTTYADMSGDPDAFEAMWLRDKGIFHGETVGASLCFNPDKAVTRGEFLVMLMDLLGIEKEQAQLTSGFADETDTPAWMQPYVVAALSDGIITGVSSNGGMVFRPAASLTNAEAAVMVQNILNLPRAEDAMAASDVPVWAESAISALSEAGIPCTGSAMDIVTRRGAANLLYAVFSEKGSADYGLLTWAAND
ncbi:MAG: Ig-like domain-containing protein [Oscillospiraceae bacterium]|nr:Ig-like domain-containing protein [Oscillospiraceae bacterium]